MWFARPDSRTPRAFDQRPTPGVAVINCTTLDRFVYGEFRRRTLDNTENSASTELLRKMRYQPLLGLRPQEILPARFDTLPNPGAFGHTHIVSVIIMNGGVR
jgi:hypothetical protein